MKFVYLEKNLLVKFKVTYVIYVYVKCFVITRLVFSSSYGTDVVIGCLQMLGYFWKFMPQFDH